MCTYVYVCTRACIYIFTNIYIYMCVCLCVCPGGVAVGMGHPTGTCEGLFDQPALCMYDTDFQAAGPFTTAQWAAYVPLEDLGRGECCLCEVPSLGGGLKFNADSRLLLLSAAVLLVVQGDIQNGVAS